MQTRDALALATNHGWTNDSDWARSTVEAQVSLERDGFLAAVQVYLSGKITWTVQHLTADTRTQRGTAPSVETALDACDAAISARTGTLF